jgi:hypothetical protein
MKQDITVEKIGDARASTFRAISLMLKGGWGGGDDRKEVLDFDRDRSVHNLPYCGPTPPFSPLVLNKLALGRVAALVMSLLRFIATERGVNNVRAVVPLQV